MILKRVFLRNFKSFYTEQTLTFDRGINLIVGKNNSGKTALLRALTLPENNEQHISLESKPDPDSSPNRPAHIEILAEFSRKEMEPYLENLTLPWPKDQRQFTDSVAQDEVASAVLSWFRKQPSFEVSLLSRFQGRIEGGRDRYPFYEYTDNSWIYTSAAGTKVVPSPPSTYFSGDIMWKDIRKSVYRFDAERAKLSESPISSGRALSNDGSNLASCMANLALSNPKRWQDYVYLIEAVLPEVKFVSAPKKDGSNNYEIKVWFHPPDLERTDLVFSLSQCGTGVGQVLCLLYAVIESGPRKIILIDEPQSFLHPGAAQRLMEVFDLYSTTHQFMITTHSPALITSPCVSTLSLLRNDRGFTETESYSRDDVYSLRKVLNEVGYSLTELFGAGRILWVEGATEELAFPKVLSAFGHLDRDTAILAVRHTGDFEQSNSKLAKEAFRIHEKLAQGPSLIPPTVGFVFDPETRTSQDLEDMKKLADDKVFFLPLRLYENYLLHMDSVFGYFSDRLASATDIKMSGRGLFDEWVNENALLQKYFDGEPPGSMTDQSWRKRIDGGQFLSDLLSALSKGTMEYRKVEHSVGLTEWILSNAREHLSELNRFLENVLQLEPASQTVSLDE